MCCVVPCEYLRALLKSWRNVDGWPTGVAGQCWFHVRSGGALRARVKPALSSFARNGCCPTDAHWPATHEGTPSTVCQLLRRARNFAPFLKTGRMLTGGSRELLVSVGFMFAAGVLCERTWNDARNSKEFDGMKPGRNSMAFEGIRRNSTEFYAIRRIWMEFKGIRWDSKESNGIRRDSMEFDGIRLKFWKVFKTLQNFSKLFKTIQNSSKLFKT